MEYAGDHTLAERIDLSGGLEEKEAVNFALQICNALQHMHSKKTVHLDLKPDNIMLRDSCETQNRVALIDFGLSMQFESTDVTGYEATVGHGTPGFAPLEQSSTARKSLKCFPAAIDIYALGATLFNMITNSVVRFCRN